MMQNCSASNRDKINLGGHNIRALCCRSNFARYGQLHVTEAQLRKMLHQRLMLVGRFFRKFEAIPE